MAKLIFKMIFKSNLIKKINKIQRNKILLNNYNKQIMKINKFNK